jgi:hypothetical protein
MNDGCTAPLPSLSAICPQKEQKASNFIEFYENQLESISPEQAKLPQRMCSGPVLRHDFKAAPKE